MPMYDIEVYVGHGSCVDKIFRKDMFMHMTKIWLTILTSMYDIEVYKGHILLRCSDLRYVMVNMVNFS